MFGMELKAVPTLAVNRQKRGIARNVVTMGATPGQSSTGGRAYAVRSLETDRVFRGG